MDSPNSAPDCPERGLPMADQRVFGFGTYVGLTKTDRLRRFADAGGRKSLESGRLRYDNGRRRT